MAELLALPEIGGAGSIRQTAEEIRRQAEAFGDRFQDDRGAVWDTCLIEGRWVRYPVVSALHLTPNGAEVAAPAQESSRASGVGLGFGLTASRC